MTPVAASPEVNGLVGWVLRRHRQRWQTETNSTSVDFLGELAGLGLAADASRLSRWELGRLVARPRVLAAYEQVTGVQPTALQAFANRVRRSRAPRVGPLPLESTFAEGSASLDRILGSGEFGSDDLARGVSTLLSSNDYVARTVAERIAETLVDRMIVSLGNSYLIVGESIASAVTHQRLRAAVLDRVEHHLADPATGALAGLPELLAERDVVPAPWLHRQLHSSSVIGRTAGAWAAARLVDRGAPGEQAQRLVTLASRAVNDTPSRDEWCARVTARHDKPSRIDRDRVASELHERLRQPAEATGTRGVSLCHVVSQMVTAPDLETAHLHGLAFMVAGGDDHAAGVLLELAVDHRRPGRIRSRAARALLYGPSATVATELDAALAGDLGHDIGPGLRWQLGLARGHVRGRPVRLTHVRAMLRGEQLAPAALYSMGMTGSPDLATVAASDRHSSQVRAAARWWLDRGPAVVD